AIAMVLGYIMMENGIYLVGTTFSTHARHIVEFGILLDVLAGVMIMGIILQNINKTFDDVDTALLRTLKE
ncbi:MAG: hydrogenase, partial [Desulfobacteraceae bacterium]|nr:hydrogenase [Desulfobacteraceae bacterium]